MARRSASARAWMVVGVSPFQKPGAGRFTSTVSWPGIAGVIASWPFWPNTPWPGAVSVKRPDAAS